MKLLRLSIKEIRKKEVFFNIDITCMCYCYADGSICYHKCDQRSLSAKIFESNIGVDMEQVLHLDYQYTEKARSLQM